MTAVVEGSTKLPQNSPITRVLRDRADSYWRDALTLRADGDMPMAVAYETIAAELRLTADVLGVSDG